MPENSTMVHRSKHLQVVRRITWLGLSINLILAIIKVAAGILGRSQAVLADGIHSLTDLVTDLAVLFGVRFWLKPPDDCHPHGHRRLETGVSLGIGLLLVLTAVILAWNAVIRMKGGRQPAPDLLAPAAALLSVVVKEWLYRITLNAGKRIKSAALTANAWHHRSDALSSAPVVPAVVIAYYFPDWSFLDGIAAVIVAFVIMHAAFKIIRPAYDILMDRGAPASDVSHIESVILSVEGVRSTHGIRTRYIGPAELAVDCHVEVDADLSVREGHDIAERVKYRLIGGSSGIKDVVVHVEPFGVRSEAGFPGSS